jgi:hypothetical protein
MVPVYKWYSHIQTQNVAWEDVDSLKQQAYTTYLESNSLLPPAPTETYIAHIIKDEQMASNNRDMLVTMHTFYWPRNCRR